MKQEYRTNWSVETLVFLGMMVALHLILTRILAFEVGPYRISLGPVAAILSGLWFGPAGGAVVGLAADLLGCFMKGYAVNPLITVAAVLWGLIPGLTRPVLIVGSRKRKITGIVITLFVTAIFSSVIFNTAGLVLIMGYSLPAILPGRLVQAAVMTPVAAAVTSVLYLSPLTAMVRSMSGRNAM